MLVNVVGYQCTWLVAVFGAARASPWPGMVAAMVFAALQIRLSHRRRADTRAAVGSIMAGVAIDGTLAHAGLVAYATPSPALAAPIWILAIWLAFGFTLGHSLAFLQYRPWLATLLGAIGAPLAYLAAARVGAVRLDGAGTLAVGAAWALALPLLARLARVADIDRRAMA